MEGCIDERAGYDGWSQSSKFSLSRSLESFSSDAGHSLDQFPAQTNIGKGAIASLEPDLEWFVAPTNDGLYELT